MIPALATRPQISGRRTGVDRRRNTAPHRGVERRLRERRKNPDQRRHQRYRVKDLFFVRLHSNHTEDVGQLLDIGRGGLSIRSFSSTRQEPHYTGLDIFLSGGGFFLSEVPFRTASETVKTGRSPFTSMIMRRMGLQFTHLTPDQQRKLDRLLRDYTFATA
jgi:hypothetical protein